MSIMSIPKKQYKLKPTSPKEKETHKKEQELEQAYQKIKVLELTKEHLKSHLHEPSPPIEAQLTAQLEECMSALLSVISIGGEGRMTENSSEPSNKNLKTLTPKPTESAILTGYNNMRSNIVTKLHEEIPPIIHLQPSKK